MYQRKYCNMEVHICMPYKIVSQLNVVFKDIQLHSIKKTAFCLKTSHFINKYDSPGRNSANGPV